MKSKSEVRWSTTRADALTRQEAYQYDPAGNLTQFTDRMHQAATFTYDNLNRRIGASYGKEKWVRGKKNGSVCAIPDFTDT